MVVVIPRPWIDLLTHRSSTFRSCRGSTGYSKPAPPGEWITWLAMSSTQSNRAMNMTAFRLLLLVILLSLSGYTIVVIANHGMNLLPVFFSDMAAMEWPGQFNLDLMCFLALSAAWVMWRHQFSPSGFVLGSLAFFGGALFLSIYLLVLSFQHSSSVQRILVGDRS